MNDNSSLNEKCIKPSILKLRSLREKLCDSQNEWQHAYSIRDFLVKELKSLYQMLNDESCDKSLCFEKVGDILKIMSVDPNSKNGD